MQTANGTARHGTVMVWVLACSLLMVLNGCDPFVPGAAGSDAFRPGSLAVVVTIGLASGETRDVTANVLRTRRAEHGGAS